MAAALGGLDALVFTGGVGEHAAAIRARGRRGLAFLGIAFDPERNAQSRGDADISAAGAAVRDPRDPRTRGPGDGPSGPRRARRRARVAQLSADGAAGTNPG